ncbi:hypothetical protein B0H16DRAFT_1713106 [Mycena metata]|uniref:TNT domain-containing protein n=1 Tax=Mycena metata TaxID=1033252 RepID=A0AAD7K4E9_9AGAR|nr:hypothetical protein B0H16DRAFT_1713106 [Mycena metata]
MRLPLAFLETVFAVVTIGIRGTVELPPAGCDCRGTNPTDPTFLCGDRRLGPASLPTTSGLGSLLHRYDRLGGLCPDEFLAKWTLNGTIQYPPFDGFQLSTGGTPIEGNGTLSRGMLLDRFGKPNGKFLAPVDTPFGQRSLPPSSLETSTNYHVYRVETDTITVLTGTIAPWFGQPGQGTQYELPPGTTVQSLLDARFLTEVSQ